MKRQDTPGPQQLVMRGSTGHNDVTIQEGNTVIVVGRHLSPFVRRVGISLTLTGLAFDARKLERLPAFKVCQPEQF